MFKFLCSLLLNHDPVWLMEMQEPNDVSISLYRCKRCGELYRAYGGEPDSL